MNNEHVCSEMIKSRVRATNYYYANKERILQKRKDDYIKNKELILEKVNAYATLNKERIRIRQSELYEKQKANRQMLARNNYANNKSSYKHNAKLRKMTVNDRTPSWLGEDDLWLIAQAYELAELRTKKTGISWHVDHVIPLRGKTVSGLHIVDNLAVIPAYENLKKRNQFNACEKYSFFGSSARSAAKDVTIQKLSGK